MDFGTGRLVRAVDGAPLRVVELELEVVRVVEGQWVRAPIGGLVSSASRTDDEKATVDVVVLMTSPKVD